MSARGRLLVLWFFLGVGAHATNLALERVGLPNAAVPIRELLLYGLLLATFPRTRLLDSRALTGALLGLIALVAVYLGISAFQDQHLAGLYYLRVYLTPLFFLVCVQTWLVEAVAEEVVLAARWTMGVNALVVVVAIGTYALFQLDGRFVSTFFGTSLLPSAWYIAGGFMRMGLPLTSPNNLGTYSALSLLLALLLLTRGRRAVLPPSILVSLLALNAGVILLTFSRSAMLTVLTGGLVMVFIPGVLGAAARWRAIAMLIVAVVVGVLVLWGATVLSDGVVSRWLGMNQSGTDPSMQGHLHSVVDAAARLEEYVAFGYKRGTVGPRAAFFGVEFMNVENSVLGVIFDMGLPLATLYFGIWVTLLWWGRGGIVQLPLLIAFVLNTQFLPYVFSPEVMSSFVFVYLLAGALQRTGAMTGVLRYSPASAVRVDSVSAAVVR
jgi:hypothetical protein